MAFFTAVDKPFISYHHKLNCKNMTCPLRISALFAAAMLLFCFTGTAQNQALLGGNFSVGSGLGYTNAVTTIKIQSAGGIKEGGNTAFQIHLTPTIGYFVTNCFEVGLGMDYLVSSSQNNTNSNVIGIQKTADTKLLFGPFTRVFFPFAGDQALFLGAVYGYGKSDTEISDAVDAQRVNTTLMTFGAGPGYAIFSNDRVSLDAQAKYNYGISRNEFLLDGASQTTRTVTTAWDFVVGIHFYFSRNARNTNSNTGLNQ
jgi:hypothetical protein